jgi:hypothetical protein
MGRHRLAIAHLLGVMTLAAPLAAQDVATAEALFNRGLKEMQARRFDTGCPALNESYRLDPRPGTLFTLAECEAGRGRIATAATRYGDYLAAFGRLAPDAQAKQRGRDKIAAQKKAALAPDIPELTLTLPPNAPRGTTVMRDDVALGEATLGVPLPVDPGEHVVTVQAPGAPPTEVRVSIAKAEKKQLTLEVMTAALKAPAAPPPDIAPPVEAAPPPPAPESGSGGQRTGALVAGGGGVAGIVLGGMMGGLALGKKSTVDENCKDHVCNHDGKLAADSGKTFALVSTIGFGVGVAGLGAAAVLVLTSPSAPPESAARERAKERALAARVKADVWSAGYDGTVIGVRGVW